MSSVFSLAGYPYKSFKNRFNYHFVFVLIMRWKANVSEKDKSDSDEKLYIEMSFFSKILCVNLCSFSWIVLRCINVLKKLFCIILYFFCAISDRNFLLFVHGFVFWLSGFFQSYLIILLYIKPFFLKMSRKENSCCS